MIQVITIPVGILETNCYLIFDFNSKEAVCIDPGAEPEKIMKVIADNKLLLKTVLLTHGHGDHIGGVKQLLSKYNVPLFIHSADKEMLNSPRQNLSESIGFNVTAPETDKFVKDGQKIPFSNTEITVFHTPGHTSGCVSFFVHSEGEKSILFSGDTLFYLNVGRIDLPGGNWEILRKSVLEKLYILSDETVVYPGHGPATTIFKEKNENPYVCVDKI